MKKQTIALSALALAALVSFSACTKKENSIQRPVTEGAKDAKGVQNGLSRTGDKITFDPRIDDCVDGPNKTCLDPVVVKPKKMTCLDNAIAEGGLTLQQLFSDETTALSLIPEFNAPEFAIARQIILSGNAVFVKKDKGDHVLYLISSKDSQGTPVMVINYIKE
ncbi:hypothetical protein [Rurimicrobium arvi]|uniref:Lipoprotein n=1 Tax=Rurimicrobium arvi TaxID=2049916 RepID=A0ABP8MQV8_9BACT